MDRTDGLGGTGARFAPRRLPADDAAAFVRERMGAVVVQHEIVAVAEAPAALVRRRIGRWARVEELGEERCRVRMDADDLSWPAMALGSLGTAFTVASPPELVEHIRGLAIRYTAAVAAAPAAP